jgi:hypothetical protein
MKIVEITSLIVQLPGAAHIGRDRLRRRPSKLAESSSHALNVSREGMLNSSASQRHNPEARWVYEAGENVPALDRRVNWAGHVNRKEHEKFPGAIVANEIKDCAPDLLGDA